MIYTQFNKPKTEPTPEGTRYLDVFQEEVKKGKLQLIKTGETCIYDLIQQDAESCKIENVLKAVAMGDLNALQQRDATYIDATTMPKNLMEAQNLVIRLKDEFYKMPVDVRKEFDNSPEKYVELMGTNEFNEIMAPYNEKIAAIAKEKSAAEYAEKVKTGAKLNIDIEKEMNSMKGDKKE